LQFTLPTDAAWFQGLVHAYNVTFRWGQISACVIVVLREYAESQSPPHIAVMWIFIAFIFVLASPFLGFGAAAWAFGVALTRPSVMAAWLTFAVMARSCGRRRATSHGSAVLGPPLVVASVKTGRLSLRLHSVALR